ncbi:hypothetical protein BABINDRAFT_159075 [Babjeviella inositovora NRRL Y-12698]|uniref:Uncharacterized protein n=1 Tax=Babjeviella inositovora NRRL Y-12698 TaxID=984486 RepID=A0A1E3QXX1_9ASCO|nr:uncharacterized protein BABINDRAFT_159075 [Babjeviella inositovora NRRL Y-12698]ODQ82499.1 hypothetical protein BABINDRAFT_159075 [Babjeviella inositovora NRRL Y-12698]
MNFQGQNNYMGNAQLGQYVQHPMVQAPGPQIQMLDRNKPNYQYMMVKNMSHPQFIPPNGVVMLPNQQVQMQQHIQWQNQKTAALQQQMLQTQIQQQMLGLQQQQIQQQMQMQQQMQTQQQTQQQMQQMQHQMQLQQQLQHQKGRVLVPFAPPIIPQFLNVPLNSQTSGSLFSLPTMGSTSSFSSPMSSLNPPVPADPSPVRAQNFGGPITPIETNYAFTSDNPYLLAQRTPDVTLDDLFEDDHLSYATSIAGFFDDSSLLEPTMVEGLGITLPPDFQFSGNDSELGNPGHCSDSIVLNFLDGDGFSAMLEDSLEKSPLAPSNSVAQAASPAESVSDLSPLAQLPKQPVKNRPVGKRNKPLPKLPRRDSATADHIRGLPAPMNVVPYSFSSSSPSQTSPTGMLKTSGASPKETWKLKSGTSASGLGGATKKRGSVAGVRKVKSANGWVKPAASTIVASSASDSALSFQEHFSSLEWTAEFSPLAFLIENNLTLDPSRRGSTTPKKKNEVEEKPKLKPSRKSTQKNSPEELQGSVSEYSLDPELGCVTGEFHVRGGGYGEFVEGLGGAGKTPSSKRLRPPNILKSMKAGLVEFQLKLTK